MGVIVTIEPSIAYEVNIGEFGKSEPIEIYYTAEGDWIGDYVFKMWNSNIKNTLYKTVNLTVLNNVMTLRLDFTADQTIKGVYYYEINQVVSKRVIFKGELNLTN